jgi:ArsR family transcriptional regulator, arsenate/arsenite/antimonite-responsive transcriptional repressor
MTDIPSPTLPVHGRHRRRGAGDADADADAELAALAKALGHPARVKILRFLLSRDACMCGEINRVVPLAQSTVSQHLKVLKEAGLIVGEIDGPRVCYSPAASALHRLRRLLDEL